MSKFQDLTGLKFGRLIVSRIVGKDKNNRTLYECKCNCENENYIIINSNSLKTENTTSCGCIHKKLISNIGKQNKKYNKYDLSGELGIGWTSNTNEEFYFDLEEYKNIKDHCWYGNHKGYILTKINDDFIFLHNFIMKKDVDEIQIDHINLNKKDNTKINFRISTLCENGSNKGIRKHNTSGVTGVSWHKKIGMWQVRIGHQNKRMHLGYFSDFNEAKQIRFNAEIKYFKEFRCIEVENG